jgi:hypothetical protein
MAIVLTIALASYLGLCFTSLAMSTRNVVSVHSRELAEAGIEQAIYASNTGDTTGWSVATVGGTTTMSAAMTMTSSGLVATSSSPTAFNFGNGATGVVNITMTFPAGSPQSIESIKSQGVVSIPKGSLVSAATPIISSTLTYTGPGASGTASAPVFVNAVAAIRGTTTASGKIKFSTGGLVDSYNSNPSAGSYYDYPGATAGYSGYSAVLAAQNVAATAATVTIKSAVIHGYVTGYNYSSPSSTNWFSYVSNAGKVIGPNTPLATYIDTSRVLTSPIPYLPVFPENISSLTNTTNYTNQTTLGTTGATTPKIYQAGVGIALGTNSTISVVGPVIIISYGDIALSGSATTGGEIKLTTSSASLQIFEEYGNITLGGRGIQNLNTLGTTGVPPLPKRVALLDTNNSTGTVTISTTSPFYGVIYCPYMGVTVSSNVTICGAIVGSFVTFSGTSPTLHYDLALRNPDSTVGDAAFDYLTTPLAVSSLVASVP